MSRKYKPNHIKRWLKHVADIGCIVCTAPAQIHHITQNGRRISDYHVLPLCHFHHVAGPRGDAVHNGKFEFESRYGSQLKLHAKVMDHVARKLR